MGTRPEAIFLAGEGDRYKDESRGRSSLRIGCKPIPGNPEIASHNVSCLLRCRHWSPGGLECLPLFFFGRPLLGGLGIKPLKDIQA